MTTSQDDCALGVPAGNELLARIGEVLYGPRWQTDLARALGVADRTVRRWSASPADVPTGAWFDLFGQLENRCTDTSRMKDRLEGLLGIGGPLTLQSIPNAKPKYETDGIHFAMRCPGGKNLLCLAWRGIFVERGCTTGAEALRLFEVHSQSFYRAVNVKFEMREFDDEREVVIRSSDVILMPDEITKQARSSAAGYYKVR
jgi:hypothetical protein